jgi:hypothetical protein
MDSVKTRGETAWIAYGPDFRGLYPCSTDLSGLDERVGRVRLSVGGPVEDLAYIGLTILVFGVLWLIVKGVERFER